MVTNSNESRDVKTRSSPRAPSCDLMQLEEKNGGRYRIRTCDFHRVNLDCISFTTTYKIAELPKNTLVA